MRCSTALLGGHRGATAALAGCGRVWAAAGAESPRAHVCILWRLCGIVTVLSHVAYIIVVVVVVVVLFNVQRGGGAGSQPARGRPTPLDVWDGPARLARAL